MSRFSALWENERPAKWLQMVRGVVVVVQIVGMVVVVVVVQIVRGVVVVVVQIVRVLLLLFSSAVHNWL